jgi:hypothetical protein
MLSAGAQTVRAQEDAGSAGPSAGADPASPERLDLVLALGNAAVLAGKLDMAIASFQKFWKIWSRIRGRRGPAFANRRNLSKEGRWGSRNRVPDPERASLPDQPVVVGTLALVLDGFGKKDEAEQAYRATPTGFGQCDRHEQSGLPAGRAGRGLRPRVGFCAPRYGTGAGGCGNDRHGRMGQWKRGQTDEAIGLFAELWARHPEDAWLSPATAMLFARRGSRSNKAPSWVLGACTEGGRWRTQPGMLSVASYQFKGLRSSYYFDSLCGVRFGRGSKKVKAPSWVLGACTQREAVGGDSPPGMLSVDLILSV